MKKVLLFILVLVSALPLAAQDIITGGVKEESGSTMPGASVFIKNTTNGTSTDRDGLFTISASKGDTVVVSFLGYLSYEFVVDSRTDYKVVLKAESTQLDEFVVVGYGTQNKKDVTGAISSVKAEDLNALPVSTVDQALQGRVAGMLVQNDNAAPNALARIRIRGSNSILGSNDPLVVIDGFQDGNLNLVHPNDIESIEVLKDASALAIYGSKGANGAILITTKSGSKKKEGFTVTYSDYFSLQTISNKLDFMNAAQYAQRQNMNALELGGNQPFTAAEVESFRANGGTDWQDEIFRTAMSQNHHLVFSGYSKFIDYTISTDVLDQTGIIINNDFSRYALRGNFKMKPTDKLTIEFNTQLSRTHDRPASMEALNSALSWSPTDAVYIDDEHLLYTLPNTNPRVGPNTDYNPVALAKEPIRNNIAVTSILNTQLTYKILPSLTLFAKGAAKFIDDERSEYVNNKATRQPNTESANIANNKSVFYQMSYFLTHKLELGESKLESTALYEEQYDESNGISVGARGFISDALGYDNLGLGVNPYPLNSYRSKRTLRSFMGRFNYNLKGKYQATFTARWDASSVFGKNNKWAFFPSGALGWVVSDEEFMSWSKQYLSNFKIRTSYGITGSQAIPPGGSIALVGDDFKYPLSGSVLTPGIGVADRLANPNLKWETTAQFDAGVEAEILNGRFTVTADYYIKTTRDLLFQLPVPQASGSLTQYNNVGSVENRGIELSVNAVVIDKKVKWETTLIYGRNRNKVLELFNGQEELTLGDANTVGFPGFDNFLWLKVGYPMGLFQGPKYLGVWQGNELEKASKYGAIPGSPKAYDVNDDNLINDADRLVLGSSQPKFTFGWNNTLKYGRFDLNLFVQGSVGAKKLNLARLRIQSAGTGIDMLDQWTPTNPNTDIPSTIGDAKYTIPKSDRYVEDASYARLKNVSLGYNFNLKSGKLKSARIYVSGLNLFTLTKYTGFDPESTRSSQDVISGVDLVNYPSQKVYTIGLNASF